MRRGRWPKKTWPIAAITSLAMDDDLWARVNNSGFALSAYAFTRDPARCGNRRPFLNPVYGGDQQLCAGGG